MSNKTVPGLTRLGQLLSAGGGLEQVLQRARALKAARAAIARELPGELADGWQLARLDAEALVLVVESPAWATRLRYAQPQLLHAAQRIAGVRPQTLRVKVGAPPAREQAAERAPLSAEAAEHLQRAAATVDDERLRKALERLAGRRPGRSGS